MISTLLIASLEDGLPPGIRLNEWENLVKTAIRRPALLLNPSDCSTYMSLEYIMTYVTHNFLNIDK